jgi:hypothetical protein
MKRRFARKRTPEEQAAAIAGLEAGRGRGRSIWERNCLRYLRLLKQRGEIFDYKYEPKEFWFAGVKRGKNAYYKPDVAVWDEDTPEPSYYIEVKGFMDKDSLIKLERMAKYYPEVKVLLVEKTRYKQIEAEFSPLIEKWEKK